MNILTCRTAALAGRLDGSYIGVEGAKAIAAVLKDSQLSTLRSTPARCLHAMSLPCRPQKCSAPDDTFVPALCSLLNNKLGDGADNIVAAARELPQLVTLCGIKPEQQDVYLSYQELDVGDAKLLAFDLSKNQAIKTMR